MCPSLSTTFGSPRPCSRFPCPSLADPQDRMRPRRRLVIAPLSPRRERMLEPSPARTPRCPRSR
eukprot:751172-Hanusia_phi.AAC.14